MKNEIPVQAVSRFVVLLKEINRNGPLSLAQMAKAAGIDYSTTCRTVQTMLCHGLIARTPDTRLYSVTAMAMSLSHGFQPAHRLAAAAQPAIAALTGRIGWPVAIMTRSGASMVARAATNHLTQQAFGPCHPGSAVPVLHSASGRAFLANASYEERTGVIEGLLRLEPRSPTLSTLAKGILLDRVRDNGYATYERNAYAAHPGKTSSISVPVHLAGHVQGTLTLVFFASAMPMSEALRRYRVDLKDSAAAIEGALVASEPPTAVAKTRVSTSKRGAAMREADSTLDFVPAFDHWDVSSRQSRTAS